MKIMLFFDDWMLEQRDCLERVWERPSFVKEIFTDFYPGFLGYGGYISVFFVAELSKYVMYLAVYPPKADPETFVVRLQSEDPYHWPNPMYDLSTQPAWKGFQDVVVDPHDARFWPFAIFPLRETPLSDRGYVTSEWYWKKGTSTLGISQDGIHFTVDREHP